MRDFTQPAGGQPAGDVLAEDSEEIPGHLISVGQHGGSLQGLSASYSGRDTGDKYQLRRNGGHAVLARAGRP
jgi:hypothetical protein